MSLKILQVTSGRDVNGALVYCQLLSQQLVSRGHQVTLLCRPGSWISSQSMPGVRIITSNLDWFPTKELKRIAGWAKAEKMDLVHTHMSRAHNFGVLLKAFLRVPVVATAHAQYVQLHWRWNDLVLANSVATADFHRRFNLVPKSKLKTIYCFADVERFLKTPDSWRSYYRRELHADEGRLLIGVIGEVVPRKGHKYLFQALPRILETIPDTKLVLMGRFHREEKCTMQLRYLQKKLNLFGRVQWLGRRSNINEYLKAMDVCVMPSVQEPLGLVAVEAQAAGIPVVVTKAGGLPEIVKNEETGLLVPGRNPRALAEAVIRIYGDPELRKKVIAAGKIQAATMFEPQRLTQQVIDAYEELLAKR